MNDPQWFVIVRSRPHRRGKRPRILATLGPFPRSQAEDMRAATMKTKYEDPSKVTVQIVRDRSSYWQAYHARRQKDDPDYVKRKRKNANRWNAVARSAAEGDILPWLTQE